MYSSSLKSQNDGFLKTIIIIQERLKVAGHFVVLFHVIYSDICSLNDIDLAG